MEVPKDMMTIGSWGLVVSLFAVVVPGVVWVAMTVGRLMERTMSAHKRIDQLERLLKEEFKEMRKTLKESIVESWRHCPLAQDRDHVKR